MRNRNVILYSLISVDQSVYLFLYLPADAMLPT